MELQVGSTRIVACKVQVQTSYFFEIFAQNLISVLHKSFESLLSIKDN